MFLCLGSVAARSCCMNRHQCCPRSITCHCSSTTVPLSPQQPRCGAPWSSTKRGRNSKGNTSAECGPRPTEPEFSSTYLSDLVKEAIASGNKTVKGILTQDQMIPGLGNAIAQDIMFKAGLHPKQPLEALQKNHVEKLHRAILETLKEAIRLGGRNDEYDLYGDRGGYVRLMDKKAVGHPCPECGTRIEKTAYLGGACYFCPSCQRLL